jgi:hypothetical protein
MLRQEKSFGNDQKSVSDCNQASCLREEGLWPCLPNARVQGHRIVPVPALGDEDLQARGLRPTGYIAASVALYDFEELTLKNLGHWGIGESTLSQPGEKRSLRIRPCHHPP